MRRTAVAWIGGWTMPEVWRPGGASGDLSACQNSGPGKYRPLSEANTMCGTRPFAHCPAKSERSSSSALLWSQRAYPIAMHAESQLH